MASEFDRRKGSGFTNLNRILDANKNNKLGQTVQSGVQQQSQTVKDNTQNLASGFQQQSQASRLDSDENKQYRQSVLDKIDSTGIKDNIQPEDEIQNKFGKFQSGVYAGPVGFQQDQLQKNLQKAQQTQSLSKLGADAGGRMTLLDRFVNPQGRNQGYTAGQKKLDSTLFSKANPQVFGGIRKAGAGLTEGLQQQANVAQSQGQELANRARYFGDETKNLVGSEQSNIRDAANEQLNFFKTIDDNQQADYEGVKKLLTEGYGADEEYNMNQFNKAIQQANTKGLIQEGDIGRIQDVYRTLRTPVQKLFRNSSTQDKSGYLGYGGNESDVYYSDAGNVYSGLKLNELMNSALTRQKAQNLTEGGVASDKQRKAVSLLSKLRGEVDPYAQAEAYKAGGNAFDFNTLRDQVDADIARLKNESIMSNHTELNDLDVGQRLRRTFLPTGKEYSGDVRSDVSTLFGKDQDAGARAGALAKLFYAEPARGLVSGAVDTERAMEKGLSYSKDNTTALLNGDIKGALTNQLNDSMNTTKDFAQSQKDKAFDTASAVKDVPIVGSAINSVIKPYEVAAQEGINTVSNQAAPIQADINSLIALDAKSLGKSMYDRSINGPQQAISNINNSADSVDRIVKSVPVVGTILNQLTSPVVQARKAAERAAASIAGSVGGFIKRLFCYTGDTKIKMADGSFQRLDSLKVGDKMYLGGKITMLGKEQTDELYSYMGTKVTGSHAVFENGQFIRVQDSSQATRIPGDKKYTIYPLVNENHVIVTDSHAGSDMFESDDYQKSDEEGLIELNSRKDLVKKLSDKSLFITKKKFSGL
jgi:hypothetical protein